MEGFSFSTPVKVRFAETDAQAIAHHAVYVVWFEVARVEYLAQFDGGYPALQQQGVEALTTDVHVHYHATAAFDEELAIYVRCAEVRGARFRFMYAVVRGDTVIAEGWTGHACVDAETFRPTRVPAWLAEAITASEQLPSSARRPPR